MPKVVPATEASIADAVARLRRGAVVAFPTETVYGLGADTLSAAAVECVYRLKGRPRRNPLIAHVTGAGGPAGARGLAAKWDDRCDALAARFWPGPLTLVVPRAESVPPSATAGWPTIAVRAPDHPVAFALLEAFRGPISAPSANRSGGVSPTTSAHVTADFADVEDLLILDGGPCRVGIESTVLDLSRVPPVILRPGAVTAEALRAILGPVESAGSHAQAASPGTSPRHYAPRTPLELVAPKRLPARIASAEGTLALLVMSDLPDAPAGGALFVMPAEPAEYAARLYDTLRAADACGARLILVERPRQQDGLWAAIHDRLARAAAP